MNAASRPSIDGSRTLEDLEVPPGGSTTIEVSVQYESDLGNGELIRLTDQFSPAFGAVERVDVLPTSGSGGSSPDNQEVLALWKEDADIYTVWYDVTIPIDTAEGEEFLVSGTVDIGDEEATLPSETITVGGEIPGETGIQLRPATATDVSGEHVVDVVITAPQNGVGAYEIGIELEDTVVAEFTDYTLRNEAEVNDSEVTDDGSSVRLDVDLSEDHEPGFHVVVAELVLDTNEAGTTDLTVGDDATVTDTTGEEYGLDTIAGATLTVEKESESDGDGAGEHGETESADDETNGEANDEAETHDGGDDADDGSPGPGIPGTLVAISGAGYLLNRFRDDDTTE